MINTNNNTHNRCKNSGVGKLFDARPNSTLRMFTTVLKMFFAASFCKDTPNVSSNANVSQKSIAVT